MRLLRRPDLLSANRGLLAMTIYRWIPAFAGMTTLDPRFRGDDNNHMKGFTLIEIIIYAALISLMMSLTIFTLYQIIGANDRLTARIEIEEETNFILQKINWALNSSSTINQPTGGATSTILSINKLNYSSNPIVFSWNNNNALLSEASGTSVNLNDSRALVSQLIFTNQNNGSGAPNSIVATITVSDKNFNYSKTTIFVYDLK